MITFTKTYYILRKDGMFMQTFGFEDGKYFFGPDHNWKLFPNRHDALDLLKTPAGKGCCVIPVKVTFEY